MFQPNQVIDDRYRLIHLIGSGTFGVVWCAEHLVLHSMIALKLLVASGEMGQRGLREARAAASLRSPHVVQILDCGMAEGIPYIAMELLEGESLDRRLVRLGKLDVVETERLVRHIARAIGRAHEAGIIHRDLKPGNVFIQANDGEEMAKVLDFGIAKTDNAAFAGSSVAVTPAGVLLGTPSYMSPEQFQADPALDGRSDIWSLGVIAYECLVGRTPFDGDSINAVVAAVFDDVQPVPSAHGSVPAGFDAWFARACAKNPADRYATPREAAEEFSRLCGVGPARDRREQGAANSLEGVNGAGSASSSRPHEMRAARWRRSGEAERGRAREYFSSASSRPLVVAAALALAGAAGLWVVWARPSKVGGAAAQAAGQAERRLEVAARPLNAGGRAAAAAPSSSRAADAGAARAPQADELRASEAQPSALLFEPAASALSPPKTPRSARRQAGAPARQAGTLPKAAVQRPATECNPPWYIDDTGRPRAKQACL